MKKHLITLVIIFLTGTMYAQNRLKGPQAKNYNPLQQEQSWLSESHERPMKGPQAKNRKIIKTTIKLETEKRQQLKGPRAKNHQILRPTAPPNPALNILIKALPGLLFGRPY